MSPRSGTSRIEHGDESPATASADAHERANARTGLRSTRSAAAELRRGVLRRSAQRCAAPAAPAASISPVDRRAVPPVDERLVELVGGRVARTAIDERDERRAGAASMRGAQRAPPQEREQRVLARSGRACGRSGPTMPSPRVEVWAVRREQKITAIRTQRRQPRVEARASERHGHTVDSHAVLVITSKSPYAVRALAELARSGSAGTRADRRDRPRAATSRCSSSRACSRRCAAPASCSRQRGVKGGYSFARPPAEITVLEVVELLEGELGADAADAGRSGPRSRTRSRASWPARRSPRWPSARRRPRRRRCTTSESQGFIEGSFAS